MSTETHASAEPEHDGRLPEITRSPVTAFAIGLVSGIASALLGIGGGLLMIPGMVLLLRFRQHHAVGTSLAVILPAALAAAYRYHLGALENHLPGLEPAVVAWLAVGGVAGALLGARAANALRGRDLRRLFGGFVIAVGVLMCARVGESLHPDGARVDGWLPMLAVGVASGALSGLLGVGGGIITVPMLTLLLGYSQHLAQGTSLAVIIPVSVSGALAHALKGNVIGSIAGPLALGAVLGAWVTAGQVFAIPPDALRLLFGAFVITLGVSMVLPRGGREPTP